MITLEQVLIATPEELRRWCGLLQYGEIRDMWVCKKSIGGSHCTDKQEYPEATREPCAQTHRLARQSPVWRLPRHIRVGVVAADPLHRRATRTGRLTDVAVALALEKSW
jgi:hypothetical protein